MSITLLYKYEKIKVLTWNGLDFDANNLKINT